MSIDLQSLLQTLDIEYTVFDNGMLGVTIGSEDEHAPIFPLVLFTWTGGDGREYVRLMITPFVECPEGGYPPELADTVMIMNDDMPRVKFVFDEDGDLGLVLDLDAEEFSGMALQRDLDLLGAYADYYFPEVSGLVG